MLHYREKGHGSLTLDYNNYFFSMAKKTPSKSGSNMQTIAEIGALAAAGVAAGYYFYASKDAEKNRKVVKKWATDLKTDVIKQARNIKNIDQKAVVAIVADAANKFESMKSIDKKDLARAARELKTNWRMIAAEVQKTVVKGAKKAPAPKKIAKKVLSSAKKAVKKASK
jgi:hypothetical protein